jgi:hypothetical protein
MTNVERAVGADKQWRQVTRREARKCIYCKTLNAVREAGRHPNVQTVALMRFKLTCLKDKLDNRLCEVHAQPLEAARALRDIQQELPDALQAIAEASKRVEVWSPNGSPTGRQ